MAAILDQADSKRCLSFRCTPNDFILSASIKNVLGFMKYVCNK